MTESAIDNSCTTGPANSDEAAIVRLEEIERSWAKGQGSFPALELEEVFFSWQWQCDVGIFATTATKRISSAPRAATLLFQVVLGMRSMIAQELRKATLGGDKTLCLQ